jgi:glycosyltransferase involved in cell wall biosynthesis
MSGSGRSVGASRQYDVVMFTMDAQIDRRILLAVEALGEAGLGIRVFAPAGTQPGDPGCVSRIGGGQSALRSASLAVYRRLRDGLGLSPALLHGLYWRIAHRPERSFVGLFAATIARTPARVYIAHDLPMLPVALAAAERHGGRVLYDSHELYPEQDFFAHERRLWREVEARHIRRADAIVTVNPSIAGVLARRHGIDTPLVVQNCDRWRPPPDRARRQPLRDALDLGPQTPVVLYQGGLLAARNIDTLVRAFALIEHPTAVLAVLGDGPVSDRLQRLAARLGLAHRVRFHPAVAQDQLPEMTASADFGVIPYQATCLSTRYCTPNKLYEYIMARLPVIATDLPEITRIVLGSGVGLVGDTADPQSFARLVDMALSLTAGQRQAMRYRLDEAARELCWEREAPKYAGVVSALMSDYRDTGFGPATASASPRHGSFN